MRSARWRFLAVVLALLTPSGCSRCASERTESPPTTSIEAQTTAPDRGLFDLALLWPVAAPDDPVTTFRRECPAITIVEALPQSPTGIAAVVRLAPEYVVPDMESLAYFGRGLDEHTARAIQRAPTVLIVAMETAPERAAEATRLLTTCAGSIALATGALVADDSTRLVYSAEAWRDGPVSDWSDGIPSFADQVTVRAYRLEGGGMRAVSLGMQKFARSDLALSRFEEHHWDRTGMLLTYIAQTMIEGHEPTGTLALDPAAIRDAAARESIGDARARTIELRPAAPDEGDPENRLLEPVFPGDPSTPLAERQAALLRDLFVVDREISRIDRSAELDRLVDAARVELRGLRDRFTAGLPAGQRLRVAATFRAREIMWMSVTEWPAPDRLVGILESEPEHDPARHSGDTVEVSIADVMDYLLIDPDGRLAGGRAYDLAIGRAAR